MDDAISEHERQHHQTHEQIAAHFIALKRQDGTAEFVRHMTLGREAIYALQALGLGSLLDEEPGGDAP